MKASCCHILQKGKIKLGWITVRFVYMAIFWDNGILQKRDLRIDELGNSTCWHFIIVNILSCLKFTTSCFWYSLWHLEQGTKCWNLSFIPSAFFVKNIEFGKSLKSSPPISVKTNFINFIKASVADSVMLNLVWNDMIQINIHKNQSSSIDSVLGGS